MDDKKRGLYSKYHVERNDGSSEKGGKHENCFYFVLDIDCDKFALPALKAYAEACKNDYPVLAGDLFKIIDEVKSWQ